MDPENDGGARSDGSRCAEFHGSKALQSRDRETSALALHLVQASPVYVNTRMVRSVLGDPDWATRFSSDDLRWLSPLIFTNINSHGRFELDLDRRIAFESGPCEHQEVYTGMTDLA